MKSNSIVFRHLINFNQSTINIQIPEQCSFSNSRMVSSLEFQTIPFSNFRTHFHFQIPECFSAHSDRSRSRSGPVRSVPVAADIKRDVDFDCPEEFGYYPHPTDCTLYYVCVFGGALLESCTGGLMYR